MDGVMFRLGKKETGRQTKTSQQPPAKHSLTLYYHTTKSSCVAVCACHNILPAISLSSLSPSSTSSCLSPLPASPCLPVLSLSHHHSATSLPGYKALPAPSHCHTLPTRLSLSVFLFSLSCLCGVPLSQTMCKSRVREACVLRVQIHP